MNLSNRTMSVWSEVAIVAGSVRGTLHREVSKKKWVSVDCKRTEIFCHVYSNFVDAFSVLMELSTGMHTCKLQNYTGLSECTAIVHVDVYLLGIMNKTST